MHTVNKRKHIGNFSCLDTIINLLCIRLHRKYQYKSPIFPVRQSFRLQQNQTRQITHSHTPVASWWGSNRGTVTPKFLSTGKFSSPKIFFKNTNSGTKSLLILEKIYDQKVTFWTPTVPNSVENVQQSVKKIATSWPQPYYLSPAMPMMHTTH